MRTFLTSEIRVCAAGEESTFKSSPAINSLGKETRVSIYTASLGGRAGACVPLGPWQEATRHA